MGSLDSIEQNSAEWLEGCAEMFSPFEWDTKQEERLRRKSFGEAGLYLLQAHEMDAIDLVPNLADRITEHVNDPRYHQLLNRDYRLVRMYGYPIMFADRSGRLDDPALREDFEELLTDSGVWSKERVPFEMLDLWHMSLIQGVEPQHDHEELLPLSCLNYDLDIFDSSLEDMNTITHDVMFYGALGMDFDQFPDLPAPYDVSTELKVALFRTLAERNYDSGLELLMSGVMQRQIPTDLARIWLGHTANVAENFDFVPKRLDLADDLSGLEVDDEELPIDIESGEDPMVEQMDHLPQDELEWIVHYHANCVAGIAARTIRREWSDFVEASESVGLDEGAYDVRDVQKLAQLVKTACDYDLKQVARQVQDLAGSPVVDAYPDVFGAVVEFLESQKRRDGHFGYWPDEFTKFVSMGYEAEMFERQMVAPTSEVCEEALEAVGDD